jgi:hypothetical protein
MIRLHLSPGYQLKSSISMVIINLFLLFSLSSISAPRPSPMLTCSSAVYGRASAAACAAMASDVSSAHDSSGCSHDRTPLPTKSTSATSVS